MAARRRLLGVLAAAGCLGACIQDDGTRFNPIDAVIPRWDVEEQSELGMEVDRQLQQRVAVIHDPLVAGFLNDLGRAIVEKIQPQPFVYRFRVIADPSLNAFALPGGYIYFHSGTLLAAGDIDELAGVMGHEIAHVKARHHFRMAQRAQGPSLLAGLAGMAAAVATGEPGILVAAQAANVALQLRYSREFEAEADQLGGIFMTRAGFDPESIAYFFERILAEQKQYPDQVPPYLYSHPAVEDRIASVRAAAATLSPTRRADPALAESLSEAQARLAQLLDARRVSLPPELPPADRSLTDPLLAEAERQAARGALDEALLTLSRAEAAEPLDPRVPYRIGDLLAESGRHAGAVTAYRRAVRLDPSRALVFFKLGLAYKNAGDAQRAIYALEQAIYRAGDGSSLERRAAWEVDKLTFAIVVEAGFADGADDGEADTPAGFTRDSFAGDDEILWWARLGPRFLEYSARLRVRWIDPSGEPVQEGPVERLRKPYVAARLEPGRRRGAGAVGTWTVEARLDDDVIDRRSLRLRE